MSTPPAEQQSRKQKVKAAAGMAVAGAVVVVWYLLTGNFGDAKDFTGQDLRDQGDRFHRNDLVGAIFNRANISGLDMIAAQLHESEMIDVIAEGTNLQEADFRRSDLTNANFRGARLVEANFAFANLTGADFRDADLRGVNFHGANLSGADLRHTVQHADRANYRVDINNMGRACDRRTFTTPVEHCRDTRDENDCCPMQWTQVNVEGLRACRTPYAQILSHVTGVEALDVTGEVTFLDPNSVGEDGVTYCERTLLR